MQAIIAGLVGLITREIIQYLGNLVTAYLAKLERQREEHAAAVNQAAQDNEKATHIDETSKSDDVDAAIDDSLKHL